jgi:hypothetical protein
MTKRNRKPAPKTLDNTTLARIGGGMNKADLTEQLAFCDDMTIAFRK